MSAFFTLVFHCSVSENGSCIRNGRKGQILTPYPSNPFTVPKCKFALCAIVRTANSANSHGEFGEFARRRGTAAAPRRRGAAHRQHFWHAACIGSWQVHTISRFTCMARRIRGANSHGVPAPRPRGAAHRHPPSTANGAAQRERRGEFTARSWPQLLMWARCHTAAR